MLFEVKVLSHGLTVFLRVLGAEEWRDIDSVVLLTFRTASPESHPVRAASGDTFAADDAIAWVVMTSQCYASRCYG